MKAITLHQPYASLIVLGAKKFETRSWHTNHRGQVAIHAGKFEAALPEGAWPFVEPVLDLSTPAPAGAVLGVAHLVDCQYMTRALINEQTDQERSFGTWEIGRFAWRFDAVVMFEEPIPATGKQGLWNWEDRR